MSLKIKRSPAFWTTLFILITFELCCCHAHLTNDSSSNDTARMQRIATWRARQKVVLVARINLFLVTFPCILLFAFVFVCYTCIYKQQKLHGWIVLAITGSLFLRFWTIFLNDLPAFYFYWNSKWSFQGYCVMLGEH